MRDKAMKLVIGALLHDIGKVIYRSGDGRNHSISGYDFLEEEIGIEDKEILDTVRYHHGKLLSKADILKDSNAYIVYIADNIAAASDRREGMEEDYGFEPTMPLSSVFNILNKNNQDYIYMPEMLNTEKGINYPGQNSERFGEGFYNSVKQKLKDNLLGIQPDTEYINSLLEVTEATCTYIPSSTNRKELADISLYDHVKMTAAISSCILQYLEDKSCTDYKQQLFDEAESFYKVESFCLYSMDISGIQEFIYTINSKDALKTLRARSFYLEIMMEYVIDELLERLELSRANLIYAGGGHCYILIPNTEQAKNCVETYEKEINQWFLEKFDTALYIAGAYCECSANQLKNTPNGSYPDLYKIISTKISEKKICRYNAQEIIALNTGSVDNYERECSVCKRVGQVSPEGECFYCRGIKAISKDILYSDFFVVTKKNKGNYLELPEGKYLTACNKEKVKQMMNQEDYVRTYSINRAFTGKHVATKLWVGNYTVGTTFDELAQSAQGIKKIAVYRADVDNLGSAFVNGFKQMNGKYETISRTATLSRQLSLFFKQHINHILRNPQYCLTREKPNRNITIVYSGGDDIFVVGSWNDVVEFSIDLQKAFNRYTQGTLTLSGGIGIYKSGYPVSIMAKEVEGLESQAKNIDGKNALTLFQDNDVQLIFKWELLNRKVLGEKFQLIQTFFETNHGYGNNFLYHLLELMKHQEDKINLARYVYILSRMEPDEKAEKQIKDSYHHFSKQMYEWIQDENSRKELIAAIYIYIYLSREEKEEEEHEN